MNKKLGALLVLLLILSGNITYASDTTFNEYGIREGLSQKMSLGETIKFDHKYDIPVDKDWTVKFNKEVDLNKIFSISIRNGDIFIPVNIGIIGGQQAKITPVNDYDYDSNYSVNISLMNGNHYQMDFKTEKPSSIDYSINNPAPIGAAQIIGVDNLFDNFTSEVKVTEFIRGDKALEIIKARNFLNPTPEPGKEYILVKLKLKMLSVADSKKVNIHQLDFKAYNNLNVHYSLQKPLVLPNPSIETSLYEGGVHEGYSAYLVDKSEPRPKLVFGENSRGNQGIWFRLYN